VYAFARVADDFADEGNRSPEERLALLDDWRQRLQQAAEGRVTRDGSDAAEIFLAIAETIRTCQLDVCPFENLLSAFRQDVTTKRYATWDELLDYCRRSANPVGRLVLGITGHKDDGVAAHSDAVCTALQLTNFWQDLERDWKKGRLYVPQDLIRAAGANEADVANRRMSEPWRSVLQDVAARTRQLFMSGKPIADAVGGRLGWELRATWLGGVRVLDRIEAVGFDVFRERPSLGMGDAATIALRMLAWR